MAEVAGALLTGTCLYWNQQLKQLKFGVKDRVNNSQSHRMQMQSNNTNKHSSSFCSKITTDLPLYESPGASFDQYLNDRSRVFRAIFPDTRRSQRLNDEEWRIEMLPIDFLFLTVKPVVDMRLRCKSQGQGYPFGVPKNVTRVLELEATRWELRGLDYVVNPSDFVLEVRGALYSEKRGTRKRLKGHLGMSIGFVLPPVLAIVPQDLLRSVAESVLNTLLENMKNKVNGSLVSDFRRYTTNRHISPQERTIIPASEASSA